MHTRACACAGSSSIASTKRPTAPTWPRDSSVASVATRRANRPPCSASRRDPRASTPERATTHARSRSAILVWAGMPYLPLEPLPRFIAQVIAILLLSRLLGRFARRVGQPLVVAEIIAGILLGP